MSIQEHTSPEKLERYSFLWTEVRLVIAAIALFIGGVPPLLKITPYSLYGPMSSLLTIAWIISGLSAAYLLYRWYKGGMNLFGTQNMQDKVTFLIATISGINLGIVGLLRTNIGMNISSSYVIFIAVGCLYLWSTYYLYKRWKQFGERLF
ncbi:MAG: hypothetical protein WAX80_00570 [Minisyncoccia bacterium]